MGPHLPSAPPQTPHLTVALADQLGGLTGVTGLQLTSGHDNGGNAQLLVGQGALRSGGTHDAPLSCLMRSMAYWELLSMCSMALLANCRLTVWAYMQVVLPGVVAHTPSGFVSTHAVHHVAVVPRLV
jgi:hypothetical protein